MKILTYSIAFVSIVLAMTSCTKNGDLQPVTKSVIPAVCDSTKLVSLVLDNLTGIGSYNIIFSGSNNYIFSIAPNATATVTVKPGSYSIVIYAPGNVSQYDTFVKYSTYRLPVPESGAKINNISVTACAGPQFIEITK
jgi:hypothetical protein